MRYRVTLDVIVDGPDVKWEYVADLLQQRLDRMRLRGGFVVFATEIDEAADDAS